MCYVLLLFHWGEGGGGIGEVWGGGGEEGDIHGRENGYSRREP